MIIFWFPGMFRRQFQRNHNWLCHCTVDLIGEGRLTTILTIPISESTVLVTDRANFDVIELVYPKMWKQKNNRLSSTPND